MFDLTGKTALVTGASRGLGRGIAVGLALAGADIIATSAHLETLGSAVASEVEAARRAFTRHPCDSRRSAQRCTGCWTSLAAREPPSRHPRQQRRHDQAQPRPPTTETTTGTSPRGEPQRALHPHA